MKKILFAGIICFDLLTLFSIQPTYAANQNRDADYLNQAFKEMIKQNNEFARCTPTTSSNGIKVLGISNGKCHFYNAFLEYGGKTLPTNECYVPMNVLKQEMQKQNEMLSKGSFSYDSSKDPFKPYCKELHGTIKSKDGSLNY